MAKCDICGKGAHFGNNVSHSHRRSNRIWNSNVQRVTVKVNGANKKMHVCTRCLRSGKVYCFFSTLFSFSLFCSSRKSGAAAVITDCSSAGLLYKA